MAFLIPQNSRIGPKSKVLIVTCGLHLNRTAPSLYSSLISSAPAGIYCLGRHSDFSLSPIVIHPHNTDYHGPLYNHSGLNIIKIITHHLCLEYYALFKSSQICSNVERFSIEALHILYNLDACQIASSVDLFTNSA